MTGPTIKERVDVMYTLGKSGQKRCVMIVEMKEEPYHFYVLDEKDARS